MRSAACGAKGGNLFQIAPDGAAAFRQDLNWYGSDIGQAEDGVQLRFDGSSWPRLMVAINTRKNTVPTLPDTANGSCVLVDAEVHKKIFFPVRDCTCRC
jgi:hypothetical protein